MNSGLTFNKRIESILANANISYTPEVAFGGLRPDFIVNAPDGRKIIVETKLWKKHPGFTQRASHQAKLYQEVIGADHALIVIEALERSRIKEGVVTANKLIDALESLFEQKQVNKPVQHEIGHSEPSRSVFAAMPFDEAYDDVYFVSMAYAAQSIGAVCQRTDQEHFTGDIVSKIKSMIVDSIAVIVDLSESKPNVLYEAGYAHALKKHTVHICSTPLNELPFDVSHWNTLKYSKGQTFEFREQLAESLRAIIS